MGCSNSKGSEPTNKLPTVSKVEFFVTDEDGNVKETVTSFDPSVHQFNLIGKIDRRYTGLFTFNWIAENTKGVAPPNYEIVSVATLAPELELYSRAELPREWPIGEYRVDILAGGELIKSAHFTVEPSKNSPSIALVRKVNTSAEEELSAGQTFSVGESDVGFVVSGNLQKNFMVRYSSPSGDVSTGSDLQRTNGRCVVPYQTTTAVGSYTVEVVAGDSVVCSKTFTVA